MVCSLKVNPKLLAQVKKGEQVAQSFVPSCDGNDFDDFELAIPMQSPSEQQGTVESKTT